MFRHGPSPVSVAVIPWRHITVSARRVLMLAAVFELLGSSAGRWLRDAADSATAGIRLKVSCGCHPLFNGLIATAHGYRVIAT
jgi:hypothetical protein